jgi:hypothetical protein
MKRKFYRTVIQIEILSEDEPFGDGKTLEEINDEITYGHCSGKITTETQEEMTAGRTALHLIAQGSDPAFFMLDKDGNNLEDD